MNMLTTIAMASLGQNLSKWLNLLLRFSQFLMNKIPGLFTIFSWSDRFSLAKWGRIFSQIQHQSAFSSVFFICCIFVIQLFIQMCGSRNTSLAFVSFSHFNDQTWRSTTFQWNWRKRFLVPWRFARTEGILTVISTSLSNLSFDISWVSMQQAVTPQRLPIMHTMTQSIHYTPTRRHVTMTCSITPLPPWMYFRKQCLTFCKAKAPVTLTWLTGKSFLTSNALIHVTHLPRWRF